MAITLMQRSRGCRFQVFPESRIGNGDGPGVFYLDAVSPDSSEHAKRHRDPVVAVGIDGSGEFFLLPANDQTIGQLLRARTDATQVRDNRRNAVALLYAQLLRSSDLEIDSRSSRQTRQQRELVDQRGNFGCA